MRTSGYVPNFTPPSKRSPSNLMWLIVTLCVFVPPLGLIMLWARARNPLRGKLIVSIIALLSMTLMLTIYFSVTRGNANQIQTTPPVYYNQQPQTQTGQPADPTLEPTTAPTDGTAPTPAPANPGR